MKPGGKLNLRIISTGMKSQDTFKYPTEAELMLQMEQWGYDKGWAIGHNIRIERCRLCKRGKVIRGSLFMKIWREDKPRWL